MGKITKDDIEKVTEEALSSNSENLSNYFRLVDNVKKYSKNNIALINGQTNGEATIVKSFNDWKKDGVKVNKGEKALKIFIPSKVYAFTTPSDEFICFKSQMTEEKITELAKKGIDPVMQQVNRWNLKGVLFDIKQTNASETEYIKNNIMPKDELHQKLLSIAEGYGINVEYSSTNSKTHEGTVLGFATIRDTKTINLDVELDEDTMNKVFLHEIAHLQLGHLGERYNQISNKQCEFEAEAVAHLVATKYGIQNDKMSNSYLRHYYDEEKFSLEDVTDHIVELSNELIKEIESCELEKTDYKKQEINSVNRKTGIEGRNMKITEAKPNADRSKFKVEVVEPSLSENDKFIKSDAVLTKDEYTTLCSFDNNFDRMNYLVSGEYLTGAKEISQMAYENANDMQFKDGVAIINNKMELEC